MESCTLDSVSCGGGGGGGGYIDDDDTASGDDYSGGSCPAEFAECMVGDVRPVDGENHDQYIPTRLPYPA